MALKPLNASRLFDESGFQDSEAMDAAETTSLDQQLQPDGITGAHGLVGAAHKRFVIVTTLLSLIDPVRGEPTSHSLDRHPHDDIWRLENLQKKFLDSFALICSTSRAGGQTASAVCLEQGHPTGNVLRLARNLGVSQDLIDQLQEILDDLAAVAAKGKWQQKLAPWVTKTYAITTLEKTMKQAEPEILLKIINLTSDKIWSLLEKLRNPEDHIAIQQALRPMEADEPPLDDGGETNFRQWITKLPALVSLKPDATTPTDLIPYMKWACQARWTYAEQIEALFCSEEGGLPLWIKYVYKLARYFSATKAMLKLATKQRDLFTSIHVEAVQAPSQQRFSLGDDKTALRTAIQRLTKVDPGPLLQKLGQIWLTDDPEARLRRACRLMLTVHAEMQLLAFYDHHPHLTPRLLFMGTSKKACFLCHEFMSRHPLAIGVSGSHQKLYPAWMPAPCSSAVRKMHKVLLWEFSRHLEQTTIRDLETRLGIRRPTHMDSTAGPSLTSTGTISSGLSALEISLRPLADQIG